MALRTMYLLKLAANEARLRFEAALRPMQLTPGQYVIMNFLRRMSPVSAADLARVARVTPQAINELVPQLERKGVLSRQEDAANRRILRIELTDAGKALLAACDAEAVRVEAELFGALPPEELAALRRGLAACLPFSEDTSFGELVARGGMPARADEPAAR